MGKIVTGLCNSNSVIKQPLVFTLFANDFMACEIVCRINSGLSGDVCMYVCM